MAALLYFAAVSVSCLLFALVVKATARESLFSDTGLDNVIFTSSVLFEIKSRSVLDCGGQCSSEAWCVTFTHVTGSSSGSCRGHNETFTSTSTNVVFVPGAKTFARPWLTLGTFCRAKNESTSFYIEAEDGYGFSADSVHWRSNAEGKKTVWLRKDENLRFNFCLPASDNITLEEIRYSTDGLEMEGAVLIDDNVVGTFKTANNSNYGLNWNVFHTTACGFNPVSLDAGRHTLVIALRDYIDDRGIEIDGLNVSTASNSTMEELACDNPAGTTGVTEPYTETTQSTQK